MIVGNFAEKLVKNTWSIETFLIHQKIELIIEIRNLTFGDKTIKPPSKQNLRLKNSN